MAARQALRLCEADLLRPTGGKADMAGGNGRIAGGQHRVNTVTTKATLRAVGLPPHLAATLRSRLRLIPEPEDSP